MAKEINNDTIAKFENDLNNHPVFNVASHAAQENGIYKASQNLQTKIDLDPTFSIEIDTGKPADQKRSGRCWMFSALNTMRHPLQKKFKLKDFELSQNYTNFWDKFEKSNWFFENVIATADKDLGDRKVSFLFTTPQQDGGQWLVIYGAGGLGNLGVQWAKNVFKAHVIAVDISDEKLQAVKEAGADMVINSAKVDPAKEIQDKIGGAQAAVVTATAAICYDQALASVRAAGKVVAISLPKGNIDVPIAKTVLDGIEIVSSLVGTRQDLAEAFELTAEGAINPIVHTRKLSEINDIVDEMKNGKIVGRMVVDFTNGAN